MNEAAYDRIMSDAAKVHLDRLRMLDPYAMHKAVEFAMGELGIPVTEPRAGEVRETSNSRPSEPAGNGDFPVQENGAIQESTRVSSVEEMGAHLDTLSAECCHERHAAPTKAQSMVDAQDSAKMGAERLVEEVAEAAATRHEEGPESTYWEEVAGTYRDDAKADVLKVADWIEREFQPGDVSPVRAIINTLRDEVEKWPTGRVAGAAQSGDI